MVSFPSAGKQLTVIIGASLFGAGYALTNYTLAGSDTYSCFLSFAVDANFCWLGAGIQLAAGISSLAIGGLAVARAVVPYRLLRNVHFTDLQGKAISLAGLLGLLLLIFGTLVSLNFQVLFRSDTGSILFISSIAIILYLAYKSIIMIFKTPMTIVLPENEPTVTDNSEQ